MGVIGWTSLKTLFAKPGDGSVAPVPSLAQSGASGSLFSTAAAQQPDHQIQFVETLRSLSHAIEAKDRYTCGHSDRVGHLAAQMAEMLGLSQDDVNHYRAAGLLHDIGKIGVSESALRKCGRLTDEEFCQIKQHPEIGYNLLRDIPMMENILPGVLHHHERWDGRGYPHGLAAGDIPLMARCLALADTFDAMSSTRPYRRALPRHAVLDEICRAAGSQFDPSLAEVFTRMDLSCFDALLCQAGQLAA